jgi:hypothetical protein
MDIVYGIQKDSVYVSCLSGLLPGTFVHSMNRLSLLHIASQHVLFGLVFARSICTYVYQLTDMYQVI